MRLVMMGTGPFAVPTFRWLLGSPHEVRGLITRPVPPPQGRTKSVPNPMRQVAEQRGLDVFAPEDINAPSAWERLDDWAADLLVVCDYGQILANDTLARARLGGINLHGSLLPKYRGAAPINWAIYHGEQQTGVTVIQMTTRLDAGPCLTTRTTAIGSEETAGDLEPRLAVLGVEAVSESIDLLAGWDGVAMLGTPQDFTQATRAPRLKKGDGNLDWNRPAAVLSRQVRAFQPWPGSFTYLHHQGNSLRLILERVRSVEIDRHDPPPGHAVRCDTRELIVATGQGGLAIERLQPAGKRVMDVAEFLNGHRLQPSDYFGPAA